MFRLSLLVFCVGAVHCIIPGIYINTFNHPKIKKQNIPHYDKALHNIDTYLRDLLVSFPVVSEQGSSTENINLRLAFAVLDGLVAILSSRPNGLRNYDSVYESYIPQLFFAAQKNSKQVVDRLLCLSQDISHSIKSLEEIMDRNENVKSICENSPSLCDKLIQAIIDTADDNGELKKESKRLLAFGDASSLYLEKYRDLIMNQTNHISEWNVLDLLVKKKDFLKPLIASATKARVLMSDGCAEYRLL